MTGRRATGWTALAAGTVALAAALTLLLRPVSAAPDAGEPPVVQAPSVIPSAPSARPSPLAERWTPTRTVIADLEIDAPVLAVGVADGGILDVPDDPQRLGWWIGSALPGDRRGTVLVAGHVDTARDGRGALYRLETLAMGSTVEVEAGGRTVSYEVTARRSYTKERLPDDLFSRDTPARLALVTCGGAFRDGTYDHNVVVYATPR